MIKIADRVLSASVFKNIMLIMLFPMNIVIVHSIFGGYVKYALIFGILVCLWLAVRGNLFNSIKDNKVVVILLVFSILYGITILLNKQYDLTGNIKKLVYFVVFTLLVVCFESNRTKKSISKDMLIFSSFVVGTTFILSFFSMLTYIYGISEWFIYTDAATGEENVYNVIGSEVIFYGFCNPNTGSAIASLSILASLFVVATLIRCKSKSKIIMVVSATLISMNIVMQYVMVLLYASRGSYYSLLITIGLIVFIVLEKRTKKPIALRTVIATLCASALLVTMVLCSNPLIKMMNVVQKNVVAAQTEKTFLEEDIEKMISLISEESSVTALFSTRLMDIKTSDLVLGRSDAFSSSGRTDLWKAGIKIFLSNPIFGYTKEGMTTQLVQIGVISENIALQGGLHNIYLTVLCSSGIVGFAFYVAAISIALVTFFKAVIKKKDIDEYMLFSFAITVFYLISELVEQRTVYTASIFTLTFWAYFGYMYYFARAKLKEED